MDIAPNISLDQKPRLKLNLDPGQVNALTFENEQFNKSLNAGRTVSHELGKDDFLKLLITQLSHQDPTQPLGDKEFIAQMAQFSTLEQVTNLSNGMANVAKYIQRNEVISLLGKVVEIFNGNDMIKGKVEKIRGGDTQEVFVGGKYYDYRAVESVIAE